MQKIPNFIKMKITLKCNHYCRVCRYESLTKYCEDCVYTLYKIDQISTMMMSDCENCEKSTLHFKSPHSTGNDICLTCLLEAFKPGDEKYFK